MIQPLTNAVCLSLTLSLSLSAGAAALKSAKITEVHNEVTLAKSGGETRAAAVDDVVSGSDAIRTGKKSRAEVEFPDKSLTRLGSNTSFSFNPQSREMRVDSGIALVHVPPGGAGATIVTPAATCAIRGDVVAIRASLGATQIVALSRDEKGPITITHPRTRETRQLRAGQMLSIAANAATLPQPVFINVEAFIRTSMLLSGAEERGEGKAEGAVKGGIKGMGEGGSKGGKEEKGGDKEKGGAKGEEKAGAKVETKAETKSEGGFKRELPASAKQEVNDTRDVQFAQLTSGELTQTVAATENPTSTSATSSTSSAIATQVAIQSVTGNRFAGTYSGTLRNSVTIAGHTFQPGGSAVLVISQDGTIIGAGIDTRGNVGALAGSIDPSGVFQVLGMNNKAQGASAQGSFNGDGTFTAQGTVAQGTGSVSGTINFGSSSVTGTANGQNGTGTFSLTRQ